MADFYAYYPSAAASANPSVGTNGAVAPIYSTEIAGIDGSGNLIPVSVDSSGNVNTNVITSALPSGAATSAKQDAGNASLASIDGKVATEATLAAFSAKSSGSLVPEAYDYIANTYVGATTDLNTVTYKTGGAGGTTVATLTMGYDGSNRLTSITRS